METVVGVFASRDRAERAITELEQLVPEESIVFLTCSEGVAQSVRKRFGAVVGGIAGGATGVYAGIVATVLVPGVGPVFAMGVGAVALLGLAGVGSGAALGKSMVRGALRQGTAEEKCSEDVAFFREVLREGRSLVVVRTESKEMASFACDVLDRLGMGMRNWTPAEMTAVIRQTGEVALVEIAGRITMGDENLKLREMVRGLLEDGTKKVVLNLREVHYIDSSGLGELIKAHTTLRGAGGQLRLSNLNARVKDLFRTTRLDTVFDIDLDEASAIQALTDGSSQAVA